MFTSAPQSTYPAHPHLFAVPPAAAAAAAVLITFQSSSPPQWSILGSVFLPVPLCDAFVSFCSVKYIFSDGFLVQSSTAMTDRLLINGEMQVCAQCKQSFFTCSVYVQTHQSFSVQNVIHDDLVSVCFMLLVTNFVFNDTLTI